MQQYYFLFALAFIFTIFATWQDFKKREVSNWLNFSFIAFALAYRAFFSAITKNYNFFLIGLSAFVLFFILAHALYYSKVFAGGDAKLLMGFGIILPASTYLEIFLTSAIFLFSLFLIGAAYSLIYSIFIISKNKNKFKKTLFKLNKEFFNIPLIFLIIFALLIFVYLLINSTIILFFLFITLIPPLYLYTKSLEKTMILLVSPNRLTEGDWLEKDIKLSQKITIKKTIHGLSMKDIQLLRKYKKPALIKQGIPFVPAFLITLIIMALAFLKFPNFSFFLFNF